VLDVNDTEIYDFNALMSKYDIYTYIYGEFTYESTVNLYKPLKRKGTRVRVTFKRGLDANECGIFFAGNTIDFGTTINQVNLSGLKYGKIEARKADFETYVDKRALMQKLEQSRIASNTVLAFVVDPIENTSHNHIVIIGKLDNYSGVADNSEDNIMSFSIEQNIRK